VENKTLEIAAWLDGKKGQDIVAMDVSGHTSLCDVVILVTALSARHAQAMAEDLGLYFRQHGWPVLGVEGMALGEWVLLDGGDVVVHVFVDEVRQRYNLEGMYAQAPRLWPRP